MPIERSSRGVNAADVEGWFAELGIAPIGRDERDGITSWDLSLDGRRRFDVRATVILDPAFAAIVWIQYAPPLNDSFRVSYQKLLRWNDQYPFAKFALGEDLRLVLTAELTVRGLDRDELGLALARLLAICDRLLDESAGWLGDGAPAGNSRGARTREAGAGEATPAERVSRQVGLFARYADQLTELAE